MINSRPGPSRRADRLTIGVLMLLTAGLALGIWLILPEFRRTLHSEDDGGIDAIMLLFVFALGGVSLVGPPLQLMTARGRPWGAGRFLWFAHGTAAWLLWPPVVYLRARGQEKNSAGEMCFYYGTPLMAVYVTFALLAGGHFRRSRRRRMYRSWQETFGLLLGLLWACTGLYWITLFYGSDLFGK
jgi:hypothetical protein